MMKRFLKAAVITTVFISGMALAQDAVIPWATNSGGTESTHIAAMVKNLNAQHQQINQTQEGVWATNSGSIRADEIALISTKPVFKGYPELMPHQN